MVLKRIDDHVFGGEQNNKRAGALRWGAQHFTLQTGKKSAGERIRDHSSHCQVIFLYIGAIVGFDI